VPPLLPPRSLRIDAADALPIWSQIEQGVRRLVASGALARGAGVPSVRDLARELRVNPATVSKAYQRLTDAGLLEVRRGNGTYVATDPPALGRSERARAVREDALRYAAAVLALGATRDEALDELKAAWADLSRPGRGGER
jgi:DNA-binding transcriptional regulator YhcF (GntR family)